jgi:5-formyltetrahydrofolate cyclo-ligase
VTEFNSWASENLNLVLPRVRGHDLEFAAGEVREGAFGIAEPQGTDVPIAEIDLMIVPALAADMAGNRLGKGKGFYDRVLANYSGKRIAVIFDSELIDSVPSEPHDQRVQIIVTPLRTIVVG